MNVNIPSLRLAVIGRSVTFKTGVQVNKFSVCPKKIVLFYVVA